MDHREQTAPSPPGRLSRDASKRQTRDRLLTAAATVFADKGFAGASVDDIAAAAGFSKGAVYSNFGGKDDLFLSLLDERIDGELGPRWLAVFGAATPIAERSARAQALLTTEVDAQRPWTVLELEFFLYALREPTARAKLARRYVSIRAAITGTLERHFAELGTAPPLPVDQLAWALLAMATGLEIQSRMAGAVPPDVWRNILTVLLAGDPVRDPPR